MTSPLSEITFKGLGLFIVKSLPRHPDHPHYKMVIALHSRLLDLQKQKRVF